MGRQDILQKKAVHILHGFKLFMFLLELGLPQTVQAAVVVNLQTAGSVGVLAIVSGDARTPSCGRDTRAAPGPAEPAPQCFYPASLANVTSSTATSLWPQNPSQPWLSSQVTHATKCHWCPEGRGGKDSGATTLGTRASLGGCALSPTLPLPSRVSPLSTGRRGFPGPTCLESMRRVT